MHTQFAQGHPTTQADSTLVAQLFAGICDVVDEGIITTALDGTILTWNPGAERMYGYSAAETIGQHVRMLAPRDRTAEPSLALARIARGEPSVTGDTIRARKDGQQIECVTTVKPLRDAAGQVIGALAVVRDLTATRQVARRLEEREHQLNGMLDQIVSGVFIVTADGRVRDINAGFSRLFGYSTDDVIGRQVFEFVPQTEHTRVLLDMQAALGGYGRSVETQIVARDGSVHTVLGQSTAVPYDGQTALLGVVIDVTEHKETQVALQRANRLLRTIGAANEALVRAETEAGLMSSMCDVLVRVGQVRAAAIAIADSDGSLHIAAKLSTAAESEIHEDVLSGAERALRERTAMFSVDEGYAWLPLVQHGEAFGCLILHAPVADPLEADERTLLLELGDDLAYGIMALRHRADREAGDMRLRRSMEEAIAALAATLEMRDPYTAGHQRHVADLATAIGREIGMEDSSIAAVRLAAIVHDIGKIKIPAEMLTKPGRLTPIEEQLLQTHAQAGYDILKSIDFPWPIAEIVWQHHERLDGSGYPRGLRGHEILPEARVLVVADIVEAMSADRPYRFGKGVAAALATIEAGRVTQYDPAVVDACAALFREGRFSFGEMDATAQAFIPVHELPTRPR